MKRSLVLGVCGLVAAAAVGTGILLGRGAESSVTSAGAATSSPAPDLPTFGLPDAQRLESALGSGDPGRTAAVIAIPPGEAIDVGFVGLRLSS